jgi:hypothetical protein
MPLGRKQSVVSLDSLKAKRGDQNGFISKALKTRIYGGASLRRTDPFGLYLICGKQRQGKTVHMVWLAERLQRAYAKKNVPVRIYSNLSIQGLGPVENLKFSNLPQIFARTDPEGTEVTILLLDEMQIYFPRETKNKKVLDQIDNLLNFMCQLGKRRIYLLATSQIYGRVHKAMREQCLYMIEVERGKIFNKASASYILGDDVVCDEQGRWSGNSIVIRKHGLPKARFSTTQIIQRT